MICNERLGSGVWISNILLSYWCLLLSWFPKGRSSCWQFICQSVCPFLQLSSSSNFSSHHLILVKFDNSVVLSEILTFGKICETLSRVQRDHFNVFERKGRESTALSYLCLTAFSQPVCICCFLLIENWQGLWEGGRNVPLCSCGKEFGFLWEVYILWDLAWAGSWMNFALERVKEHRTVRYRLL